VKLKLVAAFLALFLPLAAAENVEIKLDLQPGQLEFEPSFAACSYYFRALSAAGPYSVEFRRAGATSWQHAFDPVSDLPEGIWKGSLFDLPEDTAWEVRVVNANGAELIAPGSFRTWSSQPKIVRVIDLSAVPGAEKGLVITEQGSAEGWIKYTAPSGWRMERPYSLDDPQRGAITVQNARYIIIENLTVIGGGRHGIAVENSDSVRVLNCDISGWGRLGEQQYTNSGTRGKYADANGELINLEGGVEIDRSSKTVVERCYIHDPRNRANSWQYSHPAGPSAIHVNQSLGGTVLRWNDCIGSDEHRWNDVIEASSNAAANGGFFRDSDISGNFLAFGNDDGVELEGGGMNVRFYRNKIEGTTCGVSTGACLLGPQFVYGNLVANLGDETGLSLMLFKNSHGVPQRGKRHFINNTLYALSAAPYGNYNKTLGTERIGYMRNNIFVSSSARLPDEKMRRDDFDGDLFWTDNNAESSGRFLAGLHRIGQEKHGLAAQPEFVSAAEGDFHLVADSPARGKGLPVASLVNAGVNLGAFSDDATEVPYRPLSLTAVPRQLDFNEPEDQSELQVRVSVPASAKEAMPFEIRQNRVFNWFKVQPASGTVRPGETVTLKVSVDSAVLHGRPQFKGAFLVRTPSGLSRPVTVYAASKFSIDLRPSEAPNTAYIEAASVPGIEQLVRETTAPGVFDGKYVALVAGPGQTEIRSDFMLSQPGHYVALVRAGIESGVMNRRDFTVTVDGGEALKVQLTPDYDWNTDNDRFRAIYLGALGELKPGKHEVRVGVKGALNLNEIIITDTPSAFMADGWQRERQPRAE
jgi:hypothetical protein